MSLQTFSKLLSICIPTYNRGHRAYALVNSLLDMECIVKRDDVEIIVSDNASTEHIDEYRKIRDITDNRVIYDRNDENIQFYGNYNKLVKMSNAHYCIFISDEDCFDETALNDLLSFLEKTPDIGVMKTGTSYHYTDLEGGIAAAGEEALKRFYLKGNYISGALYNREYVTDELIDGLRELYESERGYYDYPHLFVEAYVLNIADYMYYDTCLITEGENEGDIPSAQNVSVPVFSSWERRTEQLTGFLRLIRDLNIDDGRKQLMFMMAICKTISLIRLVKDKYIRSGINWSEVYVTAGNRILEITAGCGISVVNENLEQYLLVVKDFIEKDMA